MTDFSKNFKAFLLSRLFMQFLIAENVIIGLGFILRLRLERLFGFGKPLLGSLRILFFIVKIYLGVTVKCSF